MVHGLVLETTENDMSLWGEAGGGGGGVGGDVFGLDAAFIVFWSYICSLLKLFT